MRLRLQPIGNVDEGLLRDLGRALAERASEVTFLPRVDPPGQALDGPRNRYLASFLLDMLRSQDGEKVLGITDLDLYAANSEWIFGYADVRGKAAVISTCRLHSGDRPQFVDRVLKEAIHELGHTLGLDHCPRLECVMHFSEGLRDTDLKGLDYCSDCRSRLCAS